MSFNECLMTPTTCCTLRLDPVDWASKENFCRDCDALFLFLKKYLSERR